VLAETRVLNRWLGV